KTPTIRSRSASPVLRTPPPAPEPTQQYPQQPPTPPTTTSIVPKTTQTKSEDSTELEKKVDISMAPRRTPPPVPGTPAESASVIEYPSPRSESKRKSGSSKSKPPTPMQRYYSETPVASTLSGLMQNKSGGEHPVQYMPPSPPLTRRSTLTSSRSLSKLPTLQKPSTSVIAESVLSGEGRRPSSSGSGVSMKDVRRVGKHLGQNPIDYLIPNGSLPAPVSGYFHPLHDPYSLEPPPSMCGDDPDANPVAGIFNNLNTLLDSYLQVLSSGGSLAVGTGYRSVARRLLERVEGMFARDLGVDGAGWAEVLEYTRGGRPKPVLCVLPVRGLLSKGKDDDTVLHEQPNATKELAESVVAGVREKPATGKVEQWLEQVEIVLKTSEDDNPHGEQQLTKEEMEEEDRVVCQIIEGILATNTAPDQIKNFRRYLENVSLVNRMRLALARLYPEHPIETINAPSVALYMLLHPELHPLLLAISNVSEAELDLINSGRFDAFLDGSSNVVARDEDEELTTLTALDKRLWSVLEGLEDEIEDLHTRALVVRRALKSRKDCISKKRPSNPSSSRSASPVQSLSKSNLLDKEAEDELRDVVRDLEDEDWHLNVPTLHLPIMPDDSASNITFNRRRRKERADKLTRDESERKKEKEKKREKKDAKLKKGESEAADTLLSSSRRKKKRDKDDRSVREKSRTRDDGASCTTAKGDKDEKEHKEHREHRHRERKDRDEHRERKEERKERKEAAKEDKDTKDK
ncbi:hypothetical protein EDC01DRAFT_595739, partial [Geopyxis carbonaria]